MSPAPDMVSVIAAALAAHDTWVPDTEHSADVLTDIDAATEADAHQPLNCEHSHHHHPGWQHVHRGPETHYVKAIHRCDGPGPLVYPACTPFAQYVQTMMFKSWMCTHCKTVGEGRNMVQIVTIIESRTS